LGKSAAVHEGTWPAEHVGAERSHFSERLALAAGNTEPTATDVNPINMRMTKGMALQ
jgi:hypothetical protein